MKLTSIAFLRNKRSPQGVLESFSEGLEEAFSRLGVNVEAFDYEDFENGSAVDAIKAMRPNCTIGFNILLPEDSPLDVPHYAPLCDSATYYPELRLTNHLIASFMEQDSFGFYKRLGVEKIFFLPHAISRDFFSRDLHKKREFDVVLPGSFVSPDAISKVWKEELSASSYKIMVDLAEEVLASPHVSHLLAFSQKVEERGAFEKELLDKKLDFFSQLNMLEVYIRNTDRLRLVQNINEHTVHIFCPKPFISAWQKALGDKKNVQYHDAVPFTDLADIFSRSRLVINSIPTIKRGLHERFLLALSQGASVLTNENIFITNQFFAPKAILNVLAPSYRELDAKIHEAFANEEARLGEVQSTHSTIKQEHTWDARAKALVEILPTFLEK